jgi:hypothetical protein
VRVRIDERMKLALLFGVHSNRIAFDAVIADAKAGRVEVWWVRGGLVAIGHGPLPVG